MRELARRTGETSYLADWGEHDIRVLASVEGTEIVRVAEVAAGPYEHGHARANGKVLLAYAWPELREAYLRRHQLTSATIVDPVELDRELGRIRKRGSAYDREDGRIGVSCLAAPVFHEGHVVASLALSVPAQRFKTRREELTKSLLEVAASAEAGAFEGEAV